MRRINFDVTSGEEALIQDLRKRFEATTEKSAILRGLKFALSVVTIIQENPECSLALEKDKGREILRRYTFPDVPIRSQLVPNPSENK